MLHGSHAESVSFAGANQSSVRRLQYNLHDTLVPNSAPSAIFQLLPISTSLALCSVEWHRPRYHVIISRSFHEERAMERS
jgi:hypothetical protein